MLRIVMVIMLIRRRITIITITIVVATYEKLYCFC